VDNKVKPQDLYHLKTFNQQGLLFLKSNQQE